jgi:hypothetical protein
VGLGLLLGFGVADGVGVGGAGILKVGIGTDTPPDDVVAPPGGTST